MRTADLEQIDGSIELLSSDSGGTGSSATSDTTNRITLNSYQGLGAGGQIYGELIRLRAKHEASKQAIAWYDSFTTPGTDIVKAWINYHYKSNYSYEAMYIHDHISIETPMSDGTLSSRLEVQTANADTTGINTFSSNFTVFSGVNGTTGTDGSTKSLGIFTSAGLSDFTHRQYYNSTTYPFGEADATTKYNKLVQTFTPGQQRYTGVRFWKYADTGTFTGTVTIEIYANSAFLPTGSPLATKTYSNADWLALSTGQNTATFSSQLNGLTVGNSYSIQLTTSTSDNSNHPNIGGINSSKYSGGTLKSYNTTDGWVNITGDMYFILVTPSSGATRDKSIRWYIRGSSDLETNLAEGTNLELVAYDNAGTLIGTYQTVNRSTGYTGFGTGSPTAMVDVNSDKIRVRTAKTPSSAADTGNTGDIAWDANYVYVCTATNTWKRSAISTW